MGVMKFSSAFDTCYEVNSICHVIQLYIFNKTPELSELARGNLFFFCFVFLEHPSFLRVVVHHRLC